MNFFSYVDIRAGDRVFDEMAEEWRTVQSIQGDNVFMTDGGVMGLDEVKASEIRLPGESLPESGPPEGFGNIADAFTPERWDAINDIAKKVEREQDNEGDA